MKPLLHATRCAIGRGLLWFTAPVTAPAWTPWPIPDEVRAELHRGRLDQDREFWDRAKWMSTAPTKTPDITPGLLSADEFRRLTDTEAAPSAGSAVP